MKNDIRNATLLADLLRLGRLPGAWVAPPEVRELRELVRYRAKLAGCAPVEDPGASDVGQTGVIPEFDDIFHGHGHDGSTVSTWATSILERIESLRER